MKRKQTQISRLQLMLCQVCFWISFSYLIMFIEKSIEFKWGMGNFPRRHHRCHRLPGTAESDERKHGNCFTLLLGSLMYTFCSRVKLANGLKLYLCPSSYDISSANCNLKSLKCICYFHKCMYYC